MAKTKALISFAVTAKLICAFVFAYADCWFSHEAAHLVASTSSFMAIRSDVYTYFILKMKYLWANRIAPDGMPRSVASHLGLLPMSHIKKTRLI